MGMEEKHEYASCCTHAMNCAVHEAPYDTQYVACTCYVHTGWLCPAEWCSSEA